MVTEGGFIVIILILTSLFPAEKAASERAGKELKCVFVERLCSAAALVTERLRGRCWLVQAAAGGVC